MSDKRVVTAIKYGAAVAFGLLIGGIYLVSGDFFSQSLREMYRLLSDAFMLPGFLMVCAGLMIWLSNEGAWHGVAFVLSRAVKLLIPFGRGAKDENYGDYVARQSKKQINGFGFLLVTGAVFLLISLIFLVLFHQ